MEKNGGFYHPGNAVRLGAMRHGSRLPAMLAFVTVLLGAASAAAAAAQDPLNAAIATKPLIHTGDGAPQGCGLRLFAAHVAANLRIVAVETSVDVYANGTAAFNGGVFEFAAPVAGRAANPEPVAIEAVWVKSPDMGMTTPVLEAMEKGAGGYSLRYAINADVAIAVMLSAMKGESILFGFSRTAPSAESILIGAPKMARNEIDQLQRCVANLTR